MIQSEALKYMKNLPQHNELCKKILNFFYEQPEVVSAFVSGTCASGNMDEYSDLDLGFVCTSEESKDKIWARRFNWPLSDWFHRMDADHVKPYFIIYLFEPHIHVDVSFYTVENLPPQAGGPYEVAYNKSVSLDSWLKKVNSPYKLSPDWSNVIHEEERFWTWVHASWGHVARGEYYEEVHFIADIRKIIHKWHARLNGEDNFNMRRLEQRGETQFIEAMSPSFPKPNRKEMKKALLNLIQIHKLQRKEIDKLFDTQWKTSQKAKEKITNLIMDV
ncbi:MAG: hypothetical protein HOO06_14545 [Bdellovibrionaceae bacterium]|jgi:predicted nucleotidyltransferase|nr:hypothetical protein [Pseudobdellovibrionaceae bacterium]